MTTQIKPNFAGMSELLRSDEMRIMCEGRAGPVKSVAEEIAPVDLHSKHPGRYRDSFHIDSGNENGADEPRAFARVVNTAPEALSVEFGTANNHAHHTMLIALETASGGSVKAVQGRNSRSVSHAETQTKRRTFKQRARTEQFRLARKAKRAKRAKR